MQPNWDEKSPTQMKLWKEVENKVTLETFSGTPNISLLFPVWKAMQKKGERQYRRVEEKTDGESICKTPKSHKTGNAEKLGARSAASMSYFWSIIYGDFPVYIQVDLEPAHLELHAHPWILHLIHLPHLLRKRCLKSRVTIHFLVGLSENGVYHGNSWYIPK